MAVRSIDSVGQGVRQRPKSFQAKILWLVGQACSFETVFVLFLNSDSLELMFLPSVNATIPLLGLSMALGLWVLLREGINIKGLQVVGIFVAFLAWMMITYSYSPSVILAKERMNGMFLYALWTVIAGALIMANSRERVVRFLVMTLLVGLAVGLYGLGIIAQFGTVRRMIEGGRAHISWGRSVGPAVMISFAIVLFARPFTLRQILGLGFLAGTIGYLLMAGGRGPFLAAGVALVIPFLLGANLNRTGLALPRFQVIGLSAMVVIVAGVAALAMSGEYSGTLDRLVGTLSKDTAVAEDASRVRYFPAAYQSWLESPLLGHGIGSFGILFFGYELKGAYPHNIFLEILCEMGLIGLLIFFWFVWRTTPRASFAELRSDPLLITLLMLVVMSMMNAMVSSNLSGNRLVYLYLALMAVRAPPKAA